MNPLARGARLCVSRSGTSRSAHIKCGAAADLRHSRAPDSSSVKGKDLGNGNYLTCSRGRASSSKNNGIIVIVKCGGSPEPGASESGFFDAIRLIINPALSKKGRDLFGATSVEL